MLISRTWPSLQLRFEEENAIFVCDVKVNLQPKAAVALIGVYTFIKCLPICLFESVLRAQKYSM